jgi:predicted alpha/beta-hydrolase family hydrolase
LLEVDPALQDFSYGPETYDAVVIMALAAEVAGSDDPAQVAANINGVTREGTECTTFEVQAARRRRRGHRLQRPARTAGVQPAG